MKLKELYDKMGVQLKETTEHKWDNNKYIKVPTGIFAYRTSSQYAKDREFLRDHENKDDVIFYKKLGDRTFFAILMCNKRCAYFYMVPALDYNGELYFTITRSSDYRAWKNRMKVAEDYLHNHPIFDEHKEPIADIMFVTEEVTNK